MKKLLQVFFVTCTLFCLAQYSFAKEIPLPAYEATISVSDCMGFPATCTREERPYTNGQMIMGMSSDFQSTNPDVTISLSAEAAAGGGLEPAAAARAYAVGDTAAASTGASVTNWAYWISGPDTGAPARFIIQFNWSIEGEGSVSIDGRLPANYYSYYEKNYFGASQQYRDNVLKYSIRGGTWHESTGTIEGSGEIVREGWQNYYVYISISVIANAFTAEYSQVAIDPFVMIDPSDPNADQLSIMSIKGLDDDSLVGLIRGSALAPPTAVPEPSMILLLGIAIGAVCLISFERVGKLVSQPNKKAANCTNYTK